VRALKKIVRFLCSAVALIVMFAAIAPVQAHGETIELANTTPLHISAAEPCCSMTTASLYPSSIEVPGLDGIVTNVSVTLHGLTFSNLEDLAVLLTGPNGKSVVLMASYGGGAPPGGRPDAPNDVTWTFEELAQSLRCVEPEGTFPSDSGSDSPVNCGLLAPFPTPAPEGPYNGSLDRLGNDSAGEGVWSLYVYGYSGGEGVIAGGWSLSIERQPLGLLPVPPVNTALPWVSGKAIRGQALSCEPGSWLGTPAPVSFSYQWLRDGMSIALATQPSYVVQTVDEGHTLSCEVTASNIAGHQSAVSVGLVIPPDELTGGSESGGSESGGASVSVAMLKTMLNGWLMRSGDMARIASLLKFGEFSTPLRALQAGAVVVGWYEDQLSARGSSVRSRRTLVAVGKLTFPAAGTATFKIELTREGKRRLQQAKRLKLTAQGTFTTVGMAPISLTRTFILKR
jgi:hypothetical protein